MPQIVFATAFDQYAVKAFEVNAVDYLLKPFDKKRMAQTVQKATRTQSAGREEAQPDTAKPAWIAGQAAGIASSRSRAHRSS